MPTQVPVTEYGLQVFTSPHRSARIPAPERTEQTMPDVGADFGCRLAGLTGEHQHARLLVNFPAHRRHLPPAQQPQGVCPPTGCGKILALRQHHRPSTAAVLRVLLRPVGRQPPTSALRHHIKQQERPADPAET